MGILLYEILTDDFPFYGDDPQELGMAILFGEPDLSALEPELRKVVERALRKNKEERWQSAVEMKDALEKVYRQKTINLTFGYKYGMDMER